MGFRCSLETLPVTGCPGIRFCPAPSHTGRNEREKTLVAAVFKNQHCAALDRGVARAYGDRGGMPMQSLQRRFWKPFAYRREQNR